MGEKWGKNRVTQCTYSIDTYSPLECTHSSCYNKEILPFVEETEPTRMHWCQDLIISMVEWSVCIFDAKIPYLLYQCLWEFSEYNSNYRTPRNEDWLYWILYFSQEASLFFKTYISPRRDNMLEHSHTLL